MCLHEHLFANRLILQQIKIFWWLKICLCTFTGLSCKMNEISAKMWILFCISVLIGWQIHIWLNLQLDNRLSPMVYVRVILNPTIWDSNIRVKKQAEDGERKEAWQRSKDHKFLSHKIKLWSKIADLKYAYLWWHPPWSSMNLGSCVDTDSWKPMTELWGTKITYLHAEN